MRQHAVIQTFKKLIFRQLNYAANITKLTENPGLFRRLKVIFFNKLSTWKWAQKVRCWKH